MPIYVVKLVSTAQRALQSGLESLIPQATGAPQKIGRQVRRSRPKPYHVSAEDGTSVAASKLSRKGLRRFEL